MMDIGQQRKLQGQPKQNRNEMVVSGWICYVELSPVLFVFRPHFVVWLITRIVSTALALPGSTRLDIIR